MLSKNESAKVNQILEKAIFRVDDNLIKFAEQIQNIQKQIAVQCYRGYMDDNGVIAMTPIDCP